MSTTTTKPETKHTPGTWSYGRIGARTGPIRLTNKTFVVWPLGGPRFAYLPEGADEIQHANARLIAAAPDLLAACKAYLDDLGSAEWGHTDHAADLLNKIILKHHPGLKKAIARAEGGAA